MIKVNGKQSELVIADFANLEDVLLKIKEVDVKNNGIITDIKVNDEPFSEIYPHQSEDIPISIVNTIEIEYVEIVQMITDIVGEMDKVVELIKKGSTSVSDLLRTGEDTKGLDLLQDLLDVIRDFRGMQAALEESLSEADMHFSANDEQLNELLNEMNDVLANEDWILLADLLEYEFIPFCDKWIEEVEILKDKIKE